MDSGLKQSKIQLDKISPSFCLAKWNQATLHLFNGHTQSCHHVNSHAVKSRDVAKSPSRLHNTAYKQKMRKQMMLGARPRECAYCWKIEDQGQISDRVLKSQEEWAVIDRERVQTQPLDNRHLPRYLEVAFDNICNFKCLYCSPSYSSSWRAEIEKWGAYPTSRKYNNLLIPKLKKQLPRSPEEQSLMKDAFWKWWPELKTHLHHLRVTGGEPLLSKDTWSLLDSLIQQELPHLNFAINSNLGVPEKLIKELINKLNLITPRTKSITLYASIDCLGPSSEYIRHGLDEDQFWRNIELCLREVNSTFTLSFMITVSALSLPRLTPLLKKIIELRQRFPQHHIAFDTPYLRNPEHLSLQILPESFSSYLDEAIQVLSSSPFISEEETVKLRRLKGLLEENPWAEWKKKWMRRDFYIMIKECDKRRGLDFKQSFPDLIPFFDECKKVFDKWPQFRF